MLRALQLLSLAFVIGGLLGCAGTHRIAQRYAEVDQPLVVPDSLRSQFEIEIITSKDRHHLSGVLMLEGDERYRIEFRALFGVHVASLLGDRDHWQLFIPSESLLIEGEGQEVALPVEPFAKVNLHQLFPWFWGEYLPVDWPLAKKSKAEGSLSFVAPTWQAKVFTQNKDSVYVNYQGSAPEETFHSEAQEVYENVVVLSKNRWTSPGLELTLLIQSVDLHPQFRPSTWNLRYDPDEIKKIYWGQLSESNP